MGGASGKVLSVDGETFVVESRRPDASGQPATHQDHRDHQRGHHLVAGRTATAKMIAVGGCASAMGESDDTGAMTATSLRLSKAAKDGTWRRIRRRPATTSGSRAMAEARAIRRAARWSIPAVVVLALIVWFAVHAASASGAEADRYATATVTRGTVTATYTGSGTVDKIDQASTTFPVSAKVTSVHVAVGDKVKPGDPLATIDDADLRVAVIEARQTSADAEASLEQAQDAAAETATSSATPSATTAPSSAMTPKAAATPKSAPSTPASRPSSRPSTGRSEPSGGGSHPAVDLEKLTQEVRTARAELATLGRRHGGAGRAAAHLRAGSGNHADAERNRAHQAGPPHQAAARHHNGNAERNAVRRAQRYAFRHQHSDQSGGRRCSCAVHRGPPGRRPGPAAGRDPADPGRPGGRRARQGRHRTDLNLYPEPVRTDGLGPAHAYGLESDEHPDGERSVLEDRRGNHLGNREQCRPAQRPSTLTVGAAEAAVTKAKIAPPRPRRSSGPRR